MARDRSPAGKPLIFAVQHFCLQDGPGIRSIVFFKGCPLRCAWCQNPESWHPGVEWGYKPHLCAGCGACVEACPQSALAAPGRRKVEICRRCFSCVEKCPSGALVRYGSACTVPELMEQLRPEFDYFRNSGGGVTLSGGEPTLFPLFAADLVHALAEEGIPTALETCGAFSLTGGKEEGGDASLQEMGAVGQFLAGLRLVLFDIKLFDEAAHRHACGAGNRRIKKNLALLAAMRQRGGPRLWPRLPLIPGLTAHPENLRSWARFLRKHALPFLTLIPFHKMGDAKREWLNLPAPPQCGELSPELLERSREVLAEEGIACYAPGEEDWEWL